MSLFFLYVSYEKRYCDAKFESGNLFLRNVVIIVIIIITSSSVYMLRLQFYEI